MKIKELIAHLKELDIEDEVIIEIKISEYERHGKTYDSITAKDFKIIKNVKGRSVSLLVDNPCNSFIKIV